MAAEAVELLHHLSQRLHIIREDLTDLQERLEYLCGVHRRLLNLLGDRHKPGDVESVVDSFNYIKEKTSTLKRWVINYTERTGIRINLFFNISTQSDNRTNLDIARLTSKIAVTTRRDKRDSSSMITYVAFLESGRFYDKIISQHSHRYHVLPPWNFRFGEP
jgi:hypothetical protein